MSQRCESCGELIGRPEPRPDGSIVCSDCWGWDWSRDWCTSDDGSRGMPAVQPDTAGEATCRYDGE